MSSENSSDLLLLKVLSSSPLRIEEFTIHDINNLTDDKLKHLVQNFFENDEYKNVNEDDGDDESPSILGAYDHITLICGFTFKSRRYTLGLFGGGEKNDSKKIIIKFLNSLKNIMIEHFDISDYRFNNDVDIINLVGDIIKNSNAIKYVTFPMSYLRNDALKTLHNYIKDHESLKRLHFGYGSIDKLLDKNIGLLFDVIKSSIIDDIVGLHDDDYHMVFECLMNNFFISKNPQLIYQNRNLDDGLALKLSNMIIDKNINYLKEIDFSWNKITPHGISILFGSLLKSNNEDILKIIMQETNFDDDSIEILGRLIKKNKNICEINLSGTKITDKGVEILSKYVIGNTSIVSIKLNHNSGVTNDSLDPIKNIINLSAVSFFEVNWTKMTKEFEIEELLEIPIEQREIPLLTIEDVKSASKRMKEEET